MSQKFHINAQGVPAPCRAKKGNCPFGGEESHFDSLEEAEIESERRYRNEFGSIPTIKEVIKVEIPDKDLKLLNKYLVNAEFDSDSDFSPRRYSFVGPEYYSEDEDYEYTDDGKAWNIINENIPSELHDDFLIEKEGVAITDAEGVEEIFNEMKEQDSDFPQHYKFIQSTPNELEKIKSDILANPEIEINGQPVYKVDYLEHDKRKVANNHEYTKDLEEVNPRGETIEADSSFNKGAHNLKKELQDKYIENGTGIPPLTESEEKYMMESGYAPEQERINDYIEMKNDVIYGGKGPSIGTYTYVDEENDYGEKTPESLAMAEKLDRRYFAAKNIVDNIYDGEIYNSGKKWENLDLNTKYFWDDLDEKKLSNEDSKFMASKVIFRDFFSKFM